MSTGPESRGQPPPGHGPSTHKLLKATARTEEPAELLTWAEAGLEEGGEEEVEEEEEEEHRAGRMADVRMSCRRERTDRQVEEQEG